MKEEITAGQGDAPLKVVATQTKAEVLAERLLEEQIASAQLERKSKELALRIQEETLEGLSTQREVAKWQLKDLKASNEDRSLKEIQRQEDRAAQGRVVKQQQAIDAFRFGICSHRKGGMANARDMHVLTQGGDDNKYAVIKHQMINGDIWIRCQRCGRTWNPPVEINFYFDAQGFSVAPKDGTFDKIRFDRAEYEYRQAISFLTNNSMSSSVQCRFTTLDAASGKMVDAADKYRENVASSTLR